LNPRALILLACSFVGGCSSGAPPNGEQLRDVVVPGYKTPSRVLYSRSDSQTCDALRQRSIEVASAKARESFREHYVSVRVQASGQNYRAFFRPERVSAAPYESAFIICTNDSTPISMYCSVIGVLPHGCFETGYGWYKLSEIDTLIQRVRTAAPQSSRGGT
jgi:hypothetical protein